MGVPRKIHQIWIHHDDIPLHKYPIEHIQSWKRIHPNWEYRLWTKDECDAMISEHFPEIKDQYTKGSYVVKADICRVAVVILHGGIYADLDTECFKSFDHLVDDIDVTIKNNSNSFFMAPKGATYLKKFMEVLSQKHNVHQPLRFAGPMGIVAFERQYEGNLDAIMRNEGSYCEKNGLKHENAYAVHYMKKNWSQPYLVVGSAPYVPEWLKRNKRELAKRSFEICPINNAWALFDPGEIGIWTYPCDLPQRGTMIPNTEQLKAMPDTREFMPKFYRRTYNGSTKRYEITWQKSFTMMIDTIYMLIEQDGAEKIYVIGCDMMYNHSKDDYFYGGYKGRPDPLRHGEECLVNELNKLYNYARERGVKIQNLSQQMTLLPFQKVKLESI